MSELSRLPTDLGLLLEAVSGVMGEEFASRLDTVITIEKGDEYRAGRDDEFELQARW